MSKGVEKWLQNIWFTFLAQIGNNGISANFKTNSLVITLQGVPKKTKNYWNHLLLAIECPIALVKKIFVKYVCFAHGNIDKNQIE